MRATDRDYYSLSSEPIRSTTAEADPREEEKVATNVRQVAVKGSEIRTRPTAGCVALDVR